MTDSSVTPQRDADVAVVGGGVTGLALTHYLAERGVSAVTFEADERPGGVVRSERVDGAVLDLGPQRTRLTPAIRGLVADLDIGDRTLTADGPHPLYVYHDGRLKRAPLSPGAAVRTDLLSWRGKARVLLEPFTAPPQGDESVAGALDRMLGPEAAGRFFAPLYASLYASDPADMPARYSLARALSRHGVDRSVLLWAAERALRRRDPPPILSFDDGLGVLPAALADAHADRVHLGTPVERIREAGGGYEVVAGGERLGVSDVVLTTPADATGDLLSGVAPDAADRLERLRYNPLAHVYLRAPFDREGLGYRVAPGEDLLTRGVTWNASLFDRDGVATCYLGGASDPDLVSAGEERLAAVASREFETVMDVDPEVLGVHRWHRGMPAYDRSWTALDGLTLPDGIHLATNYTDRAGLPGRIRQARHVADRLAGQLAAGGSPQRASDPPVG